VRVIARRTLREFWESHPDAERPLRAWFEETEQAVWKSPNEVKQAYANASVVGESRIVFNIKGNDYRLVVYVNYLAQTVYVKFIGSHAEYDRVDVATIQLRSAHGN
jgi:mRNA interferase HigB